MTKRRITKALAALPLAAALLGCGTADGEPGKSPQLAYIHVVIDDAYLEACPPRGLYTPTTDRCMRDLEFFSRPITVTDAAGTELGSTDELNYTDFGPTSWIADLYTSVESTGREFYVKIPGCPGRGKLTPEVGGGLRDDRSGENRYYLGLGSHYVHIRENRSGDLVCRTSLY